MGNGKNIIKRIILIAAAVIVVLIAGDIFLTEINAKKIPHRFASAEEGRELLLSSTGYYDHFTQIDIDIRMKKSGATMDELLKASTEEMDGKNGQGYPNPEIIRGVIDRVSTGHSLKK